MAFIAFETKSEFFDKAKTVHPLSSTHCSQLIPDSVLPPMEYSGLADRISLSQRR